MPQVGWIINGEQLLHADALQKAMTYPPGWHYDANMLSQMFQGSLRNFMSPTMFPGCRRRQVLERVTDFYLDPDKAWALLRGTMVHNILERGVHEPDAIIEQRLVCLVRTDDGRTVEVRGQPDKVVPSRNLLIDYKTINDVTNVPKDYWISQLSCYRWMLDQHGIPIDKAYIQQVGTKKPHRLWVTDKLWSLERTERYIVQKAAHFAGVFDGTFDLENLPEPLDFVLEKEQTWQCFPTRSGIWCPVQATCFARMATDLQQELKK